MNADHRLAQWEMTSIRGRVGAQKDEQIVRYRDH